MKEPKDVTILIADDEEDLKKALVFEFSRKGYKMLDASNGVEALNMVRDAKNGKVDIIITDIRMPNGDGIGLLDAVRREDPGLPVLIFMTGFADITPEEAIKRGAYAIFPKPLDRVALNVAVKTIVAELK